MKKVIDRLLSVKSIITLTLTAAFVYMIIRGDTIPEYFQQMYTIVVSFYFGVQTQKAAVRNEGGESEKGGK